MKNYLYLEHGGSRIVLTQGPLLQERHDFICDHYVMVLITKGSGTYIDHKLNKSYQVKTGDIIQRFPHHRHSLIMNDRDNEQLFIRAPREVYEFIHVL